MQDIDRVLVGLPATTVGSTPAPRATLVSVMGKLKRRGRWSLRKRTNAFLIMGDVELDLRNAIVVDAEVEIRRSGAIPCRRSVGAHGLERTVTSHVNED